MSQRNPSTSFNDLPTAEAGLLSGTPELRPDRDPLEPEYVRPVRQGRMTTGNTYQAALRSRAVKVSRIWVFWRLLRILFHMGYFGVGLFFPRLKRQQTEERQKADALRFRLTLEKLGGVLIKVGQQMSQRPDILPAAYCDELDNLLHEIPTRIDRADVEAAIRRQTGKSVEEVFARFEWEPVGSASVSCVYRAVLHAGDEVAVKIRRPNIDREFTADLKAIAWLLHLVEFLTIWRPGMTYNLRTELSDLLLEELDFRREARHQELFRRYLKRRKKLNVTAPRVFYRYSGEEVMVSEFVTGLKVQDILAAMDRGDLKYLSDLEDLGIEPKRLAKQLVRSRYYTFHECPLFHGDPHPGNILVQPNNRIIMIDFGACGVFSERDRNLMWQLNQYYSKEDVSGMVNMVMAIMEPIDPVNGINQFKKDLLDAWWTGFYGIKSNHAEWWERSSFRLWLKYFELIRKHQIPVPRNVVRMIRATLLYDTVAARLYPEVNVFREFQRYSRDVARRTRRRVEKCAVRQFLLGPDDANFLKLQQIVDVGNGILFRVQKYLDDPRFNFAAVAGKIYSAIRSFVRMFLLGGGAGLLAAVVAALLYVSNLLKPAPDESLNPFRDLVLLKPSTWHLTPPYSYGLLQLIILAWFLIIAGLLFAYGRRVYLRFGDVDD